jgi:uncharacterized protein with PIN domain
MRAKTCPYCNHNLKENPHGIDQNDIDINEKDEVVYLGSCTYCKECRGESK